MIVRLGKRFSIPDINVVRRAEQVGLLRGLGAEYIVNSSEPEFDKRLRELCHRLGASIGFDAVAGEMSARNFPGMTTPCAPESGTAAKRSQDALQDKGSVAGDWPRFAAVRC
jgi:threonine dehydrogenase-like Zn-dependent dehydrogenase